MIADLHCHFPMHLVAWGEEHGGEHPKHWWDRLGRDVEAGAFDLVARFLNDEAWTSGWRVSLDGLEAGGAGLVCSVLYWPFSEFEPASLSGAPPDADAFALLTAQIDVVETALAALDPDQRRHVIVTREGDLDDPRMRFIHCVEGGFHLGPDPAALTAQIGELARRGVLYITLAHLLFRQVAADAPAIPPLSDAEYNAIFTQPAQGEGLTPLGRAAIRAMAQYGVVVDLSHMRADAVTETLAELDAIDPERSIPVFATHVGAAVAGPPGHAYNLTAETMTAIRDRGGLIGIIAAQHLLGTTATPEDSAALLGRHIDAVAEAVGGHQCTAIGTDLDGFIKRTIAGLERAEDLAALQDWIRARYPDDAEAILHANAERVIRAALRLRAG